MSYKSSTDKILQNIRKTRELKNYTQEYLAIQLGIDTKSYSNIENGVSKLSIDRLLKISDVLETPPESFLNPSQNFSFNHCSNVNGYLNNPKFDNYDSFREAKVAWQTLVEQLRAEVDFLKELVKNKGL